MAPQLLLWGNFGTFVLTMSALDPGMFHRQTRVVNVKEYCAGALYRRL